MVASVEKQTSPKLIPGNPAPSLEIETVSSFLAKIIPLAGQLIAVDNNPVGADLCVCPKHGLI